jgi:hypothetical protein
LYTGIEKIIIKYFSSYTVAPVNKNNNNIIIPAPPTTNPGYPTSLFFVTSDVPANPAPTISSIVTSSYVIMIFEVSEILFRVFSYSLFSSSLKINENQRKIDIIGEWSVTSVESANLAAPQEIPIRINWKIQMERAQMFIENMSEQLDNLRLRLE